LQKNTKPRFNAAQMIVTTIELALSRFQTRQHFDGLAHGWQSAV
jgi:hypothetical protein